MLDRINTRIDSTPDSAESMHVVREGTPTDLNVFVRGDVTVGGVGADV